MLKDRSITRRFLTQLIAAQISARALRARPAPPYPFVDGLTIPSSKPDPVAFSESGLSGVIMDISAAKVVTRPDGINVFPRVYEGTLKNAAAEIAWLRDHPSAAFLATRGSDIKKAYQDRRTAIFFQTQGCDWLEDDLDRLSVVYELGLRVLQITHNHSNAFGGAGIEREWTGLTSKGQELIRRMNEMNIIPDVSHASHLTALDVLKSSRRPVTLSHGAARSIVNHARCAPDEVIRGVAASGGVMGIFMMSFWLTNDPEPTVDALIRQIRHVIRMGGLDSVGISNDYSIDGQADVTRMGNNKAAEGYRPWWNQYARAGVLGFDHEPQHVAIPELNNIGRMYTIQASLEKAGFTARETEKVMGGNWIRFLTESLG